MTPSLAGVIALPLMLLLLLSLRSSRSHWSLRFYWSDVNLWAQDLPDKCLVVLSGRDDLLHVQEASAD